MWNCIVNIKGGVGNNVFLDFDFEYDNYYVIEFFRGLGVNVSEMRVNRICRVFFLIVKLF